MSNGYSPVDMSIDALTRSMDELQDALCGIRGIQANVEDLQAMCSIHGADDDQRRRIGYLRLQAAQMAVYARTAAHKLTTISDTSIDVSGDIKRSIELIEGGIA